MRYAIDVLKSQIEAEFKAQAKKTLDSEGLHLNHKLAESWLALDDVEARVKVTCTNCNDMPKRLTDAELSNWNNIMRNADGTVGGHWSEDQTTTVAANCGVYFEHITKLEWNAAMNMMYSDYYLVAKEFNTLSAPFFASLAKAFLFDLDGGIPYEKLCKYYMYVVMPGK